MKALPFPGGHHDNLHKSMLCMLWYAWREQDFPTWTEHDLWPLTGLAAAKLDDVEFYGFENESNIVVFFFFFGSSGGPVSLSYTMRGNPPLFLNPTLSIPI
jgi:lipid-A-disaccharide synthase-like uncharacterized protein